MVYKPGFTDNGLAQENKVSNCTVTGYQDANTVTDKDGIEVPRATTNIWTNNTGTLNGPEPEKDDNYVINWQGALQVDEGTVEQYPASTNKYYNLSIKKS